MPVAIFAMMKGSDAYKLAVQALNSDRDAIQMLGQPITTGIPGDSLSVSGPMARPGFPSVPKGRRAKEPCMSMQADRSANGGSMRRCSRTPKQATE